MSVDLELHVSTVSAKEGLALRYSLNSPSDAAGYFQQPAVEQPIGSERDFREMLSELYEQLGGLLDGYDVDGLRLPESEVEEQLTAIGRDLYQRLFPSDLRTAYREFRQRVNTLLVVSDDRWAIPWELIRPFDEGVDDDFLCMKFQMTRWLAGGMRPPEKIRIKRLAAVETGRQEEGEELPKAEEELRMLEELEAGAPGVESVNLPQATYRQLHDLLEQGGQDLVHFVGHGEFNETQPGESKIELADRDFRARDLVGPMQLRLRTERPIVFFNACRVARQGWWLTGLDGWAERWVRGCGCSLFVGPLWAVDDRSAWRFAEAFYRELRAGGSFGEAAQAARLELREESGDLTWMAYAVYAHPNGRLLLGAKEPVAMTPQPGVPAEIRRAILDFGRFIAEKTAGFVGREWLFERIEAFMDRHPRGYFLLRGDPGIGKSSLAAEIVRRHGCVHHFNIRAEGINRVEDFLSNICAQLIAAFGLPHTFLLPEATRDGNFLKGLLEQVMSGRPGEKILLVIDALDEVLADPEEGNPLHLPLHLPPGVYVVVTSRRGPPFRVDCEFKELEIEQDKAGNLADVQAFVEAHLERPGIRAYLDAQSLEDETFVVEMVVKSQGNFMYLRYVLPEIERGAYRDRDFATLPQGLEKYYEDHWYRMRSRDEDAWFNYQLPVLQALTVVKEPVSMDLVVDFSGVKDRRRIRGVLVEWDAFLYKGDFEKEETGRWQKRYRLYHDSFHDFIAAKEEVAEERVDLKAAHGKISAVLWREFYGDEAP